MKGPALAAPGLYWVGPASATPATRGVRLFLVRLMALLVGAIRRASRMALAMEARGFGATPCRTTARPRSMRAGDWAWVVGAVVLAATAIGLSIALGTWRPLLG